MHIGYLVQSYDYESSTPIKLFMSKSKAESFQESLVQEARINHKLFKDFSYTYGPLLPSRPQIEEHDVPVNIPAPKKDTPGREAWEVYEHNRMFLIEQNRQLRIKVFGEHTKACNAIMDKVAYDVSGGKYTTSHQITSLNCDDRYSIDEIEVEL